MPKRRQVPPDDLWLTATDLSTLRAAWARTLANNGAAGGDGMAVARYAEGADARLLRLSTELRRGQWRPGPSRAVDVPKRKGGTRRLMIPPVADRVVQGALGLALTPVLDPGFSDASFGYRQGRGVADALAAVARWRDRGFWHVVEADIVAFFDNVRHDRLLQKLDTALAGRTGAGRVVDLVALMVEAHAQETGVPGQGVPQGSPLSPLLSNLYLDALDEALDDKGLRLVRYADDFVVLARERATAEAALEEARAVLADEGLELHAKGSRVWDFDRGFAFLGDVFVKTLQLPARDETEENPVSLMRAVAEADAAAERIAAAEGAAGYDRGTRVLHLTQPGRRLAVEGGAFAVLAEAGHRLAGIGPARVGRIEVSPGVAVDWDAARHALDHGIPVAMLGPGGETAGLWMPRGQGRAELQLAQARAVSDPAFAAGIARALVGARIRNMRTHLFKKNHEQEDAEVTVALSQLKLMLARLPGYADVAALRGAEGQAARLWWPAYGRQVEGAPVPFRRERPAADPVNAAINWLTGLLERDITDAVNAVGLHAGFGVLHGVSGGDAALVWDMMEPFRTPLTEGLAAFLWNARRLRPEMFRAGRARIEIDPAGKRALVQGYETAVGRVVTAPGKGGPGKGAGRLAWRPMMRWQAQRLAEAVRAGDPARFVPYAMEP